MRREQRRVMIVRASRFSNVAEEFAASRWPGAGVSRFSLPGGRRISVLSMFLTDEGRRAMLSPPDVVVTQRWDAQGRGHESVERAIWMLVQPRQCWAVLEDGSAISVPAQWRVSALCAPVWRVLRGAATVAVVSITTLLVRSLSLRGARP